MPFVNFLYPFAKHFLPWPSPTEIQNILPVVTDIEDAPIIAGALVAQPDISFPITMNFLSPYVIIEGAANGVVTVDGISVAGTEERPILFAYIIYYIVIGLFVGLAIVVGRLASCHIICWMAPFMIIGRWIRNRFAWPSLRLKADASACTNCKVCTSNCSMSLDVNGMVQVEQMENTECILCGTCADNCSKNVIRYSFSSGK